ncbi:hypothetical protein UlMin_029240 [Ulmus minor]
MSCIVWNVRGLGNQRAFKNLSQLLTDEDHSLVFLCETKLVARQCKNLKMKLGYKGCFVRDSIGRKRGLILLWKESMEVVIQSTSARHIDALVSQAERHWRFTGFYGSPEVESRKFSWDLMSKASIAELSHLPWLVGGDFNEILLDSEKKGGRPRALAQMRSFQFCLDLCGLKDLSFTGKKYTWVNMQGYGDCIQERLDQFFGTFDWQTLFPNAQVTNLSFFHSDHRVVKISLGSSWVWVRKPVGNKRKRRFHFEEIWASELECRELIASHWSMDKAKVGVEDVTVCLKNCAVEIDRWGFKKFGNLRKITIDMNNQLLRPFSSEKIKKALMDMNPTKAPGLDGLPALFFQKNWDIVGEDITKAALHILNEGGDMSSCNSTLITLIPKIQHPTTVKNFRPISLCTVLYKIVSRSITNRFKLILDDVIGDPQSAFVPGRLITDNVILGFEAMHWIRQHIRGKTGYAALKLDISKAYDRVEWYFLRGMMDKLGFAEQWTKLIMRCISSISYSFLINGEVKGFLQLSRGL